MKAVHRVIKPKPKVMIAKKILGPRMRTARVAGSWKQTLAAVKIKMETEYRLPWFNPRSFNMLVTDALEIIPLSNKLRLHNRPPMVQSLRDRLSGVFSSPV